MSQEEEIPPLCADIGNEDTLSVESEDNSSVKVTDISQDKLVTENLSEVNSTSEQNRIMFKKPVFIGPRKGKIGKVQICKSPCISESSDEKNYEVEDSEKISDSESNSPGLNNSDVDKSVKSVKKVPKISPAQKLNESCIPLPYKEPKWSGLPTCKYSFEVLKNGGIIETIDLSTKPFIVFGRLGTCDVPMAHPTISRFHAVLQYRIDNTDDAVGYYIFDLGSTHGTFLNKYRIKPNHYVRVHVGHLLKFGGSSRMYILQGPAEDMEQESDLTVTELKEKYREEKLARELLELKELEDQQLREEKEMNEGIDWGMGEDAEDEADLSENPFAAAPNEELYLDDPKKTLRGWFEREGYDLEYNVEEKGFGQFLCRIELPVENAKGGTIVAESLVKGKKKEAVVQCALEACRILDRYGLLRQAKHESRKRKAKNWEENDFYDSDEDEFLDRTGAVEKKRQQRMRAAGKLETQTETYDSLVKKQEELASKIVAIENELQELSNSKKNKADISEDEDALDAFMSNLSSQVPDDKLISKLKSQLLQLRKEEVHVKKLVSIACPASLPILVDSPETSAPSSLLLRKKIPVRSLKHKGQLSVVEHVAKLNTCEESASTIEEEEEEEDDKRKQHEVDFEQERKIVHNNDSGNGGSTVDSKRKASNNLESNLIPDKNSVKQNTEDPQIKDSFKVNEECDNQTVKEKNVIGPTLPPENFKQLEETGSKRKKKVRPRPNRKSMKQYEKDMSSDPNYSMWVPPEDQSGDGKTKLNEKYGY